MNNRTPVHKRRSEVNHFKAQMETVFAAFYSRPQTMLMVSIQTGILRANICRYVAIWRKENRIRETQTTICPISKHRASFLTTNPDLFPAITSPENPVCK